MPTLTRSGAFARHAFNNDAFLVDVFQEDAGQEDTSWRRRRLARRAARGPEVLSDLAAKPTPYGEDDARYWEDVAAKRRAAAEAERKRKDPRPERQREAVAEAPAAPGMPDWMTLSQQAHADTSRRSQRARASEDEMIAQVVAELLMQETEIVAALAALQV